MLGKFRTTPSSMLTIIYIVNKKIVTKYFRIVKTIGSVPNVWKSIVKIAAMMVYSMSMADMISCANNANRFGSWW